MLVQEIAQTQFDPPLTSSLVILACQALEIPIDANDHVEDWAVNSKAVIAHVNEQYQAVLDRRKEREALDAVNREKVTNA